MNVQPLYNTVFAPPPEVSLNVDYTECLMQGRVDGSLDIAFKLAPLQKPNDLAITVSGYENEGDILEFEAAVNGNGAERYPGGYLDGYGIFADDNNEPGALLTQGTFEEEISYWAYIAMFPENGFDLSALKAEDFPEIPDLVSEKGFVVNQAQLKKMLSKVSYAMGVNEPRPVLNGCFIKTAENEINVVACDGFKLAVCSAEAELSKLANSDRGVDFSFIVPVKSVNELTKLLSDDDEDTVTVYMSHKNMVVAFDDLTFFTRLIVGEFVNYNSIIIKNHKIGVKANKQQILAALEKASLITEERIAGSVRSHVKIEICEDILKVSAVSSAGSIYDEFNVEHTGDNISIAFNNRFLIDSIKACRSDVVKLSMSSPLMGINVEPCDEESGSELFMLLPVRTRD